MKISVNNEIFNKMNALKIIRSISIFWSLFIGIGALWGSIIMFIDSYLAT
jgi:hypothetical protein